MSITAGAVVFVVIWFLTMFVTLPIILRTQGEAGEVVPGTHEGAPADFRLGRTLLIVTTATVVIWGVVVWIITSGMISIEDLDTWGVMGERIPN
jgi:predicted secreted protein